MWVQPWSNGTKNNESQCQFRKCLNKIDFNVAADLEPRRTNAKRALFSVKQHAQQNIFSARGKALIRTLLPTSFNA